MSASTSQRRRAIIPPAMRKGDTLGVVAPSGPVHEPRLASGLALLAPHFDLRLAPTLAGAGTAAPHRYLAAADAQRADELNAMLRDPDIRGIMMARGGYGLTRILDQLDGSALRADPKPIVGFSDGTALLAWALAEGVRGIHGPVTIQLPGLPTDDVERLVAMLTSPRPLATPWPMRADGPRRTVGGTLIGGNLTLLTHLLGTRWALPVGDTMWFWEDVGEKPYALDRNVTQLVAAEVLAPWHGVLLGDFTRCQDPLPTDLSAPDDPREAYATLAERCATLGVTTGLGLPVGHGARNAAMPYGAYVEFTIDGQGQGSLNILDAAVA